MANYIVLFFTCILAMIIIWRYSAVNYQMLKNIRIFKTYQETKELDCQGNILHICIPCLREQSIITHTISELLLATSQFQENVKLYIVTTQKENYDKERYFSQINSFVSDFMAKKKAKFLNEKYGFLFSITEIEEINRYILKNNLTEYSQIEQYILDYYNNKPTTYDVVKKYISKHPSCDIVLLDYPEYVCSMAAQLNFCYKWIFENIEVNADHYFMVYNADCHPNHNTFKLLFQEMAQNKDVRVFQLIRAYTLNFDKYSGVKGCFLKASALYQTRWSLGFEYPMYDRYSKKFTANIQRSYYMIGHGMTFSLNLLKSINGFHETTHLEDLYAGYVLSYCREKVIPIPALENTLNPSCIKSWAKQKLVWFSGMYDVINYPTYIKQSISQPINNKWANRLRLQFFIRDTLPWLLGPTSVLLFLLVSFVTCKPIFLLGLFLVLFNSILCGCYLPNQLKKMNAFPNCEHSNSGGAFAGVVVYSLFRNIPAICYIFSRIFDISIEKFKTER